MELDQLYLLDPHSYVIDKSPRYCPACALVTGYLNYYPELYKKLEVITVAPQRPRESIVNILGENNQDSPVLIISNKENLPEGILAKEYNGISFINDEQSILNYLGLRHKTGVPLGFEK